MQESTPLLGSVGKDGHHTDEISVPTGFLEQVAPPPAAPPPPPPPPTSSSEASTTVGNDNAKIQNYVDNAPQSQLSVNNSVKSKESRHKKKSSTTSSKGSKSNKAKAKRKDGPQKMIFHLLFDGLRYLTIVTSCIMFLMQAVPLVILTEENTWLQFAVSSYLAIFYFIFVLIESRVLRGPAYSNWILRGFVYSFIGLIGLEQDLANKVEDIAAGTTSVFGPDIGTLFAMLFVSITTWIIIGVGILYAVLGLLCMQGWYERMEKEYTDKVNEWKRKTKQDKDFRKQQESQRQYERDRQEGRGQWYDDLE